jgi:L-asparaginase II
VVASVPLVRVIRSGLEESVHLGDVAVCNSTGRLVAFAGDPNRRLFTRSCAKPLQAAVSLKAAGEDPISDRELAVMCASHNGEPVHVGAVRAVLRRAGLGPEALQNPPGWPIDPGSMARSQQRNRELHNCSGKHAGMLLGCMGSGWDVGTYLRRSHPLQKRVLRAVLRATGRPDVAIGVDGCGVPVHGMRLRDVATLYARIARPETLGDLAEPVDRCVGAMLAEPYLVGGRDRVDTAVMTETADVVAKSGAEGLECAAVLDPGLGVAVKVADGSWRAGPPAVIAALIQVGALDAAQVRRLEAFAEPPVWGGEGIVGELAPALRLRRR